MNNKLLLILFISISFINFCCLNTEPNQSQSQQSNTNNNPVKNYDDLAKEYCACSEEIVALNKKMQKLVAANNFEEMGDLLSEIESKSAKNLACKEQLEQKYQTQIDTSRAILESFKKVCPELGNFIENGNKSLNN